MGIHEQVPWDSIYRPESREMARQFGVDQMKLTAFNGLKSDHLMALGGYWHKVRDGMPMPCASSLDPTQFAKHLSQIFLIQVDHDPMKFTYRLIGEDPTAAFGVNATGFEVEQIVSDGMPTGRILHDLYVWIVSQRQPLALSGPNHSLKDGYNFHEVVYLPFTDGGATITRILGGAVYYRT